MRKLRLLGACVCLAGGFLQGDLILAAEKKPGASVGKQDSLAEPIAFKKGARLSRDFQRDELAWCERVLVEPFRARAKDQPWKQKAEAYINRALVSWTAPLLPFSTKQLSEEGAALILSGCDDPLVRYLAAWTKWQNSGEWNAARSAFRKIYDDMLANQTAGAVRWIVTMDYIAASLNGNRDTGSIDDQIPTYLQALLAEGGYSNKESNVLVRHLAGPRWSSVRKQYYRHLLDGIKEAKLAPWAADAIKGAGAVRAAWESRGSGWANKVTAEGWKGFEKHLEEATTYLNRSWELNQHDPVACTLMIDVTMGGSGFSKESVRTWFDRATAAEFDFFPAYCSLANAYLPRWGGSHELMIDFAKACVATGRFDTDAPAGFFAVLGELDRDAQDLRALYRDPRIKDTLLKVSRALVEEPSRAHERPMRAGYLAVNAWLAGDYKLANSAMSSPAGVEITPGSRGKLRAARTDENRFRAALPAFASSAGAELEKAEAAHDAGNTAEAIAFYKKSLATVPPAGRQYVEAQIVALQFETDLARGGWVDVPASSNLLSWIAESGTWTPDAGFPKSGDDHSPTRIFFGARVGPAFEMEGTVQISGEPRDDLVGGLVFAPEYRSGVKQDHYGCQILNDSSKGGRAQAIICDRDYKARDIPPMDCELRDLNEFRVRVENGAVTWEVNGKPMHTQTPLRGEMDAASRVGVGSFSHHPGVTVALKKLRVRKL